MRGACACPPARASALSTVARSWEPITRANLDHPPGPVCKADAVKRIVLLDDYQGIALDYGGWDRVPDEWEKVALCPHLADPNELVEALAGAEIVVAMRERTRFSAETLDRLADLKLLVTTGMGNVAIDIPAAQRNGVVVCGTGMHGPATAELSWGLILALA